MKKGIRGAFIVLTVLSFFTALFFSCNPITGTDVLQGSDSIAPVITITSPADGDPYSATVTVTGTVNDEADTAGDPGRVDSLSWELTGTILDGTVTPGTDGSFSFSVSTVGLNGTLTLKITAVDWNGNSTDMTISLAAPKEITSFAFLIEHNSGLSADVEGVISGTDISISVPPGTDVSNLIASFLISGSELIITGFGRQESGVTPHNFTDPVVYTVIANDDTTKDYIVRIVNRYTLTFLINDPDAQGSMESMIITEGVATSLLGCGFTKAGFSFAGWAEEADGNVVYNDGGQYTMGSQDSVLYAKWLSSAKDFTEFKFESEMNNGRFSTVEGTIADYSIDITVPVTDVTALVATFTATGESVSVGVLNQISGDTDVNFTNAVSYKITAEDGSTHFYTVEVHRPPIVTTNIIVGDSSVTSSIAGTSALGGGNVMNEGLLDVTDRGLCWNTSGNPVTGDSYSSLGPGETGEFNNVEMNDLTENTTFYIRAYAVNEAGTSYGDVVSFNSGWSFGTERSNGYVFYNDGEGGGLVCAMVDQSASQAWSNVSDAVSGTSKNIGKGGTNTVAIINQSGHTQSAAQVCTSYGDGTWYLPSHDEIVLMYLHLHSADPSIGGFASDYYWSSSEYVYSSGAAAYRCDFSTGNTANYGKYNCYHVRAVRDF